MREARIDLEAVAHNVRTLRELIGTREFIAVVKADAYGHGAVEVARAAIAAGATRLGVADLGEARQLREAGIDAPIVAWLHAPSESFEVAVAHRVEVGISSLAQLQALAAAGPGGIAHLKLETGLGRNGIAPGDWQAVFSEAARLEAEGLVRIDGLFSHLSNTSNSDDLTQVRRFEVGLAAATAAGLTPTIRHIAATAAAIELPETRFDAVRIGIGLYGLSPLAGRTSADLGLRPVMTLRGEIAAVRRVPAGQGVSYGYTHRTSRDATLALVPLGYGDGVPRQASGTGPVAIGGERFTVAGRIAMDQFVVNVGDHPVNVGDEVILFGDPAAGAPSADEWADAAGTINYEIVTRIGARVPRVFVGGAE